MKNMRWTILAAVVLAAPSVAHAQGFIPKGPPAGAIPGAPGATGASNVDSGAISNTDSSSTTTTATGTTTTSPGMSTDMSGGSMTGGSATGADSTMMADGSSTMPNTGGEPLLVSLAGLTLFAGAFALRRRVLS